MNTFLITIKIFSTSERTINSTIDGKIPLKKCFLYIILHSGTERDCYKTVTRTSVQERLLQEPLIYLMIPYRLRFAYVFRLPHTPTYIHPNMYFFYF